MLPFFLARHLQLSLDTLSQRWFSAVKEYSPLYIEGNLHVLVGDGVKQSKEGRRMPRVKKLFQGSQNSAKPEYIHGHIFGGLGILAGSTGNWACILLSLRLHDGLQAASPWKDAQISCSSHVVQMVQDAYHAAQTFGNSLLLLDRYFLTVSSLKELKALNQTGTVHMDILTKAKNSCTAFEKPASREPDKGRPPGKYKYGPGTCSGHPPLQLPFSHLIRTLPLYELLQLEPCKYRDLSIKKFV